MYLFEVQNHQVSTFAVLESSLMDKYSPFNPMYPLLLHQCYMKWLAVLLGNQTSDWVLIIAQGLVPTWVITCCTNIRKLKFHKQTEKSWEQRGWISHRKWVQATEPLSAEVQFGARTEEIQMRAQTLWIMWESSAIFDKGNKKNHAPKLKETGNCSLYCEKWHKYKWSLCYLCRFLNAQSFDLKSNNRGVFVW